MYVSVMYWSIMSLAVRLHGGESQDSLLRRFQRMIQMDGILREAKANRHFVSRRDAARIKAKNSARRRRRQGNT
jgi:ribosomal protein S21